MRTPEQYDKIEDYIRGRLPEEQRQAFERDMQTDPDLAGEVDWHRDMIAATADRDVLDFRHLIETIGREEIPGGSENGFFRRWWWLGGVLLIGLAGIGLWNRISPSDAASPAEPAELQAPAAPAAPPEAMPPGIPDDQTPAGEEDRPVAEKKPATPERQEETPSYIALAESYYVSPESAFSGLRSGGGEDARESPLQEAAAAFVEKDYRRALRLAETIPASDPGYWTARTIAAHASFRLQNFNRAITLFSEIANGTGPEFADEAEGNLLLAYLAAGRQREAAFQLLLAKIIADEGHPFHTPAREIAEKVRR